jgi:hypothetical protein
MNGNYKLLEFFEVQGAHLCQQEQCQRGIIRPSILVNNKSFTPKSKQKLLLFTTNNKLNSNVIPAKMSGKKSKILSNSKNFQRLRGLTGKNNSITSKQELKLFKYKTIKLIKFQSFS